MKYVNIFAVVILLQSCEDVREPELPPNEYNTKNVPVESKELPDSKTETLYFLRAFGKNNLDTIAVKFIIKDHNVQGEMMELPYEANRKLGYVSGSIEDSIIHAAWVYDDAAKRDEMQVAFRLSSKGLFQQPNEFSPLVGKYILKDSAGFTLLYKRIDKVNFPQHLIRVGM